MEVWLELGRLFPPLQRRSTEVAKDAPRCHIGIQKEMDYVDAHEAKLANVHISRRYDLTRAAC